MEGFYSYFLRCTPRQEVSLETFKSLVTRFTSSYIISREEASSVHYHIAIFKVQLGPELLRYHCKQSIPGQWYISGKDVQSQIKAVAYCMKDGNYIYNGLDVNTILMAKSISKPKVKFDEELEKISNIEDKPIEDIVDKIIDLYIRTGRKIYIQHIRAQVELIRAKRCSTYREILRNKIIGYD